MPKSLTPIKPKRKSRAKPEFIANHAAMLIRQRKSFIKDVKEASYRHVDSYTEKEIDRLIDELYDTILIKPDLIWYRDWLANRGIHADRLKALRAKFSILDDTIKICDAMIEGRLINIPSHKASHQRHSEFMLRRYIGGIWSDQRALTVDMSTTSIFTRLEAAPIMQIRNDGHELANYETININPKELGMGPKIDMAPASL